MWKVFAEMCIDVSFCLLLRNENKVVFTFNAEAAEVGLYIVTDSRSDLSSPAGAAVMEAR